jgi:steroid delta-isomerase-like uncharacterized protein
MVQRIVDAYQSGTLDEFDGLLTDDVVLVRADKRAEGLAEFKAVLQRLRQAFPDIRYSIEESFGEGDKLVLRWTARGTHKSEYLGVLPSGRQVSYTGITIYEFRGDRVSRVWVSADLYSLQRRMREQLASTTAEARA